MASSRDSSRSSNGSTFSHPGVILQPFSGKGLTTLWPPTDRQSGLGSRLVMRWSGSFQGLMSNVRSAGLRVANRRRVGGLRTQLQHVARCHRIMSTLPRIAVEGVFENCHR